MHPKPEISRYTRAAEDEVLRIWLEASRVGHPFLSEDQLRQQLIQVRDIYLPQSETWVAHQDGAPVGFIGLLGDFVGGLFVDPARRRTGIGKQLIHHAASIRPALTVDVYALNHAALRFYRALGFRDVSRRPHDDEGRPLEIVHMSYAPEV